MQGFQDYNLSSWRLAQLNWYLFYKELNEKSFDSVLEVADSSKLCQKTDSPTVGTIEWQSLKKSAAST